MYDIVSAQTVVQGDSIFTLYSVQLRGEGTVSVRRRWGGGAGGGGEEATCLFTRLESLAWSHQGF